MLDRIGLVTGVIRRSNPFRDQLLVHLPHDELPVAEQHGALGSLIKIRFDADTRPPQHHGPCSKPLSIEIHRGCQGSKTH